MRTRPLEENALGSILIDFLFGVVRLTLGSNFLPRLAETRGQQARAIYDFNATNADEVGFQEGDIITIVR